MPLSTLVMLTPTDRFDVPEPQHSEYDAGLKDEPQPFRSSHISSLYGEPVFHGTIERPGERTVGNDATHV
jgi:hypothetical protein